MSEATHSYPTTMKKLRACFNCHLVKTEQQVFLKNIDYLFKFLLNYSFWRKVVKIAMRILINTRLLIILPLILRV
jgi:hypothetical protein